MMRRFILTVLMIAYIGGFSVGAQEIRKIDAAGLKDLITRDDDKVHVVNFWATWCSPCVKEIPQFEKAMGEYSNGKVDFLFISLDFPSSVQKSLIPFLEDRKIRPDVVLMTDQDADQWIRMVDKNWQGDLPATLIYRTSDKTRVFHPGPLDYTQLKTMINNLL